MTELQHSQGRSATSSGTGLWSWNFIIYWLGNAQSTFGSALSGTALAFLVLQLTGSAGATGLTLALAMLPNLLGPLTGTLVDRLPRRLPLVLGDLLRGALMLGVWWLSAHHRLPVEVLYGLSLLMGLIGMLHEPASQSLLPTLVAPAHLARANGLMGAADQVAGLLGLVAGGVIISHAGLNLTLLLDSLSFLVMGALYSVMTLAPRERVSEPQSFVQDLRQGLSTLRGSPVLRMVPVLGFLIMAAFAPLNMLMPKYMLTLGYGAQGYGLFMALLSGGMLLGSSVITLLGERFRPRQGVTVGFLITAAAQAFLVWTGTFWWMAPLALITGLGLSIANLGLMYLIQTQTPPDQLGRVFGVLQSSAHLGMPVTLLLLSSVADRLQPHLIFLMSSAGIALLACVWAVTTRRPEPLHSAEPGDTGSGIL